MDMSGIEQATVDVPAGTVTFLLTDVEGSTRLWESASEAMGRRSAGITSCWTRLLRCTGGAPAGARRG